ncbi:MAG: hypothetical protein ACXWLH_03850 [Candidatus Saccharimonadales bacterium]
MTTVEASPNLEAQQIQESTEYRLRRQHDPFIVLDTSQNNLGTLIAQSANGLAASTKAGNTGEFIEFSTDLAYRLFISQDYRHAVSAAQQGANKVMGQLDKPQTTPFEAIKLKMKATDLLTVQSMSSYLSTMQSGNPKAIEAADAVLEATAKRVIDLGIGALNEAQSHHSSIAYEEDGQYLRGAMFELLYATWQRLKIYQDEKYDKSIVLGATDFEDRPKFTSPKEGSHNFDIMTLASDGVVEKLVQCKDAQDTKPYAYPIEKVIAKGFERFLKDDPQEYLRALARLAGNSPDTTEEQMNQAQKLLDSLFTTEQNLRLVGDRALVGAVR